MKYNIIYAQEGYLESFRKAIDSVAREQIYIEMIEAPPIESIREFQLRLINENLPSYFALFENEVIGWCDISFSKNPRTQHRGVLGMGLMSAYRGLGLGTQLMDKALTHAKELSLEKIELTVFTENTSAIGLYRKFGFVEEGLIKNYRKLEGRYFDVILMGKSLIE